MFGLYGGVGGITVMVLLVFAMRLACGRIAAAGCSSMWADTMGGDYYKGGWQ